MPTVISSHDVIPGRESDYQTALKEINDLVRQQPGFTGLETLMPIAGLQDNWAVIFRFTDNQSMELWMDSPIRKEKLRQLEKYLQQPAYVQILADQEKSTAPVAVVFAQKLRTGQKEAFLDWQRRLRRAQKKMPGYLGTEVFEPAEGVQEEWVNIVRFDTAEHLEQWLHSKDRQQLLKEAESYVENYRANKLATGLESWFDFSRSRTGGSIPRIPSWKQAIMVLVALYPTVMLLHYALAPLLSHFSSPVGMLITNICSVSLLTWVCMPLVSKKILGFWIHSPPDPERGSQWMRQWGGLLLAVSILVGFAYLFYYFF